MYIELSYAIPYRVTLFEHKLQHHSLQFEHSEFLIEMWPGHDFTKDRLRTIRNFQGLRLYIKMPFKSRIYCSIRTYNNTHELHLGPYSLIFKYTMYFTYRGWDRIFGIVTMLQVGQPRNHNFISSPKCPDWLWNPHSLQFNQYEGLFS